MKYSLIKLWLYREGVKNDSWNDGSLCPRVVVQCIIIKLRYRNIKSFQLWVGDVIKKLCYYLIVFNICNTDKTGG